MATQSRQPESSVERAELLARVAAAPGPRLRTEVPIPVSEGMAELLDDLVTRERQIHGREVTQGQILDAAITGFLDQQGCPPAGQKGAR